jgi:ATP-binding cassette subfamily F protein 3
MQNASEDIPDRYTTHRSVARCFWYGLANQQGPDYHSPMAILKATDLGQTFGADDIFSNVSLELQSTDRIALVGPNGIGKSSLLLILSGLSEPFNGTVERIPGLTLGYLRQEAVLTFSGRDHTVYEEMLAVFAPLRRQEARLRELEEAIASGETPEGALDEYGRLQEQYELEGGYRYQVQIKRVLLGLGFDQSQWDTALAHLSAGQKTRVLLGRLLLAKPKLLILDEPTNHLDVSAVEWLERMLRRWVGALIIVSHDRYFLDKIVNRVWEMDAQGIKAYRGNYTACVLQRELEREREQQLFLKEKSRLEKEIEFVRKHIAGGQTDMAKGRLRRVTRDIALMERANEGESLAEMQHKSWMEIGGRVRTLSVNEAAKRIDALTVPDSGKSHLNIPLRAAKRSGRVVMRTGELEIGYPDTQLFSTDRLKLERQERAAIIGANGSGKSTFLQTLMGIVPTQKGWIKFGENLTRGYFAQGHDQLVMVNRVIDEILNHSEMQEAEARNYLAQFLFRGDDVFKKVDDLSGGERGRLSLAVLALDGPNLLLLDEPTNHLDIPSQEVLQAVLESYEGSIIFVTHDRYLVDQLADQIWELDEGYLRVFKGDYQQFLLSRDPNGKAPQSPEELAASLPPPTEFDWIEGIKVPPVGRKVQRKRAQRLRELKASIEDAEAWLGRINLELAEAQDQSYSDWLAQLRDESVVIQARLAALTAEMDELTQ